MADFILRALAAGLLVALIAGPLGCFVVWRRMAYFGDTLAHSALLGISFGLLIDINLQFAVILACIAIAFLLVQMENKHHLATDTILGILAHSSLAFGLVILSFTDANIDLMAYLFGDLLTVSNTELLWIAGGVFAALILLAVNWNSLLTITLHQELAQVEGLHVGRMRLLLMLLIATVIALSMKVVGMLLITSLMVIPPACARSFSSSPEKMALSASLIGCLAVCGGLIASFYLDTPSGPSIVVSAAVLFFISSLLRK
ncbi:MAG: zinc ABC transporter permease [Gammaproteobacteria bacterium]|nr:zinc ABC transporter permease [Gammaproteobacteria bacterium]|tara:strand:- start:293301 stop:294077 length:777 start_codon:yes stop_codon:yes gene_type:complete